MYINSDTLPDIFGCPNGALSAACKDVDALVDVGAELERNGYADKLNGAIRDFLTDADDGNLYLFPQALYCEFLCTEKTSLKMLELLKHQRPGKSLKRIARKSQIWVRFR